MSPETGDLPILEMAQARELLTTYHANVKRDGRQSANEWLERTMRKMPRAYDIGRIRIAMRKVQEEERA